MKERFNGLSDLAHLYQAYEELKKEQNLIDYGDQILLPAQKLKADATFRQRYNDLFRYIFVDEYQDTNYGQKEFLLRLVDRTDPKVTVVGDDDQAIYGWRGAVVENILNFHQEAIFNNRAHSQVLSTNFRCSKAIVQAANKILEPFQALRPGKILRTPADAEEGIVILNSFNSDLEEIRHMGKTIREKMGKGQRPSEIAILCRNRKFFSPLVSELENLGIPYRILDSTPLMDRWEVKELVAYLRLLSDETDELALVRILRSRRIKLGDRDLHLLSQLRDQQKISLRDALDTSVPQVSSEGSLRLKLLSDQLDRLLSFSYSTALPDLVYAIYEHHFRSELEGEMISDYSVARKNLKAFIETARRFSDENPLASLKEFVDYLGFLGVDEESYPASSEEEADGVKLMTLHKAKGLEFDLVFLPFMAERILPSERAENPFNPFFLPEEVRGDSHYWPKLADFFVEEKITKKAVEDNYKLAYKESRIREERRLFYVGVTRARRELYLSHSCWIDENEKPRDASPFIRELEGAVTFGEVPLLCTLENPNKDEKNITSQDDSSSNAGENPSWSETFLSDADQWIREHDLEGQWRDIKILRTHEIQEIKGRNSELWASNHRVLDQFSYSSLVAYRECPKLFWFRYLSGLPIFPDREEGNLGKAVHRAIDLYGRNQGVLANPEDLFSSFNLAEKDLNAAKEYFRIFHESEYGKLTPTALEMGFSLSLPEVASNLIGRMDRVQETHKGMEIIDYKTGKPKPIQDESVLLQMGIYALAGRDLWKHKNKGPIINIMFNLSANRVESKILTEEELSGIRLGIIQNIRSIQSGHFEPKPEVGKCSDCAYERYCRRS